MCSNHHALHITTCQPLDENELPVTESLPRLRDPPRQFAKEGEGADISSDPGTSIIFYKTLKYQYKKN